MFTIEVEKKKKDQKFGFEDLEMFHKECLEGKIKIESATTYTIGAPVGEDNCWCLTCQRCGAEIEIIKKNNESIIAVIKTAIDGKERKIGKEVVIVQKKETK